MVEEASDQSYAPAPAVDGAHRVTAVGAGPAGGARPASSAPGCRAPPILHQPRNALAGDALTGLAEVVEDARLP